MQGLAERLAEKPPYAILEGIKSKKSMFSDGLGAKLQQYIPIKCTLDIYIWHRLLYAVLVGILNVNFYKMDAVVIFSFLAIVSLVMRKYMRLN